MDWLKESASNHTILGNKLSNIAKRMMVNGRSREDAARCKINENTNEHTMGRYMQIAGKAARKKNLDDYQKKQIKENINKNMKKRRGMEGANASLEKPLTISYLKWKKTLRT